MFYKGEVFRVLIFIERIESKLRNFKAVDMKGGKNLVKQISFMKWIVDVFCIPKNNAIQKNKTDFLYFLIMIIRRHKKYDVIHKNLVPFYFQTE